MRSSVKLSATFMLLAALMAGCGNSSSGSSSSNPFVGNWVYNKEAIKKILMAKEQRETPNKPFDEMQESISSTLAFAEEQTKPEAMSLSIGGDNKYTLKGMKDGPDPVVVASGTWAQTGDALSLAVPGKTETATAKIEDGLLKLDNGNGHFFIFIKQ